MIKINQASFLLTHVQLLVRAWEKEPEGEASVVCCWYTCKSCYIIVFRPIEDEEPSDTDGEEVEDGTALPDAESDDDDWTTLHKYCMSLIHYRFLLLFRFMMGNDLTPTRPDGALPQTYLLDLWTALMLTGWPPLCLFMRRCQPHRSLHTGQCCDITNDH